MTREDTKDIKVLDKPEPDLLESLKGSIIVYDVDGGPSKSGRLLDIRNDYLLFESRNGVRTLVRRNVIRHAFEITPRGGRRY